MRRTLLGVIGMVTAVLAGCGSGPDLPNRPLVAGTVGDDVGPAVNEVTPLVRFVVLGTRDSKPIDIVSATDKTKKFATNLAAGTVTDYVPVSPRVTFVDHSTGTELESQSLLKETLKSPRNTMVLGFLDGDTAAFEFQEKDGKVDTGQVEVDAPGKAILISASLGLGASSGPTSGPFLTLGGPNNKCLTAPRGVSTPLGTLSLGFGDDNGIRVFPTDPGALDLTWYSMKYAGSDYCRHAATASGKVTLDGGRYAYVLPWLADATHYRFLFVPVTADGKGDTGVVSVPAGPAYQD